MRTTLQYTQLPVEAQAFRTEVREYIQDTLHHMKFPKWKRVETWMGFSDEFSSALAEKHWIGLAWPKEVGGAGRSSFARYVLTEELIVSGAPVAAHWIGDRQSGPLIIRMGTPEQKAEIIPRILNHTQGTFCIGLSEPNAGSDLSAIQSRAERQPDGSWLLYGQKVWTTGAQTANYMIALMRTKGTAADRHAGLSQFLIPMNTPGIEIKGIETMSGHRHFNEVFFNDVSLPESCLLGIEGQGWAQAMNELAFERSGVERFLSCWPLLEIYSEHLLHNNHDAHNYDSLQAEKIAIGQYLARVGSLRQMSISIASMLDAKQDPSIEAALVKEQGSLVEQDLPQMISELASVLPTGDIENNLITSDDLERGLAYLLQNSLSFSLRGGTREILRGIVARGLGLR